MRNIIKEKYKIRFWFIFLFLLFFILNINKAFADDVNVSATVPAGAIPPPPPPVGGGGGHYIPPPQITPAPSGGYEIILPPPTAETPNHYEVKEGNGPFVPAENPYIIKNKNPHIPIYVKTIYPSGQYYITKARYEQYSNIFIFVLILLLILLLYVLHRAHIKYHKMKIKKNML